MSAADITPPQTASALELAGTIFLRGRSHGAIELTDVNGVGVYLCQAAPKVPFGVQVQIQLAGYGNVDGVVLAGTIVHVLDDEAASANGQRPGYGVQLDAAPPDVVDQLVRLDLARRRTTTGTDIAVIGQIASTTVDLAPPPPTGEAVRPARPRVLVVDQGLRTGQVLARALSTIGYHTMTAATAAIGLGHAQNHGPEISLILVDSDLTDGAADTLVGQIRALLPSVPIIGLAPAPPASWAGPEMISAGADEHVISPFKVPDLARAVLRILRDQRGDDGLMREAA